ncbi:hypothetical protein [Peribacillus muralis]|uniref:hypothetical protein n=1 Tax=Peribacillus muralis TaxID=264697 RepID=UPI003D019A21
MKVVFHFALSSKTPTEGGLWPLHSSLREKQDGILVGDLNMNVRSFPLPQALGFPLVRP